jgi:hypothetical protein
MTGSFARKLHGVAPTEREWGPYHGTIFTKWKLRKPYFIFIGSETDRKAARPLALYSYKYEFRWRFIFDLEYSGGKVSCDLQPRVNGVLGTPALKGEVTSFHGRRLGTVHCPNTRRTASVCELHSDEIGDLLLLRDDSLAPESDLTIKHGDEILGTIERRLLASSDEERCSRFGFGFVKRGVLREGVQRLSNDGQGTLLLMLAMYFYLVETLSNTQEPSG